MIDEKVMNVISKKFPSLQASRAECFAIEVRGEAMTGLVLFLRQVLFIHAVNLHPKKAYTQRLLNEVPKIYEEWDLSTV